MDNWMNILSGFLSGTIKPIKCAACKGTGERLPTKEDFIVDGMPVISTYEIAPCPVCSIKEPKVSSLRSSNWPTDSL